MSKFAERLKELRLEKNLSILQLSKQVNYSDVAIGRWERGERIPNMDALISLAKFFNVTIDYLCGLED